MPTPLPNAPSAALASGAALLAALCWTVASLLWRRLPTAMPATHLNLLKNLLALLLQLPLVLLQLPQLTATPGWDNAGRLGLLAASGVVGIALGDSFHFGALRRLGTRRCLTLEAGGPALTALAGMALLGELLRPGQWLGILLISVAVLLVARQRPPGPAGPDATTITTTAGGPGVGTERLGLALALAALVCGCAGALLARAALVGGQLTPLQAASWRLLAATLVLLPLLRQLPPAASWRRLGRGRWPLVLTATLLGTSVGMALQQTALAGLSSGLAVALLSTSPLMGVLLAGWEGDSPGWAGLLAGLAGLVGVSLVVGLPLPGLG